MKNVLYGTTALVAAGLMATAAVAQDKKPTPIQITVGGTFNAHYAYTDQDTNDVRDHGLFREAEIRFRGQTRLDNGLLVGVYVSLEAEDCADQIDESWIFFDSPTFGRVEIGETDNPGWKMYYGAPNAIPGFSTSVYNLRDYNAAPGAGAVTQPFARTNLANDSNRINYFTPRIGGFQLGVGYSPENCKEGDIVGGCGGSTRGMLPTNVTSVQDVWEVTGNFVQTFGAVNAAVYGTYSTGDAKATPGGHDPEQWGVGTSLGFMGFTVGGAYTVKTDTANMDVAHWNVGVKYATGPWGFGLEYGNVDAEAAGGDDEGHHIFAGVTYLLGPGITTFAGVSHHKMEDGANAVGGDNDATVFRVGTNLVF